MATRSAQPTVRAPRKAAPRPSPRAKSSAPANGDRKQAILEAAIAEFSTKGFSGARVDAIARRARSNKQLIYYYFDSKAGLYEAVLGQLIAHTYERMAAGSPPPSLSVAVEEWIDRLLGQGGKEWIRFWLWEALESSPRGKGRDPERARVWSRWVGESERAKERGEVSECVDARMLALALQSIIVTPYLTPAVTRLITGMEPDSDAFKSSQLTLLRYLLDSLASSASHEDVDAGL
jgi:TetR/AcrR family transcriptional regulator